jgi:short-subunit dehydrogenase
MPRRLSHAAVVITGASSGIGRAAARLFARQGATLVLCARRDPALHEVATECEGLGGRALIYAADVTDEQAVQDLARHAIENLGRIDVWVNNAAVTLFSRFEETPPELYRRVIDTNLFGYVHGARAVLPCFREQGSGVLINNASIAGEIGQPYTSAYSVTKFAIRGLGECLRQELLDAPDIHVCTLLPASIDTPLFQHAANLTGRAVKPISPVIDAERVAKAIVRLAERPRRELYVGGSGRLTALQHSLMPGLTERMLARKVERDHFQKRSAPPTQGNLFAPMSEWTSVDGGWRASTPRSGAGLLLAALALATAPAVLWLITRRRATAAGRPVGRLRRLQGRRRF